MNAAFREILFGRKNKHLYVFAGSVFLNIGAALSEGLSFMSIMQAFNVLNGQPLPQVLRFSFVENASSNTLFVGFIILAVILQVVRSAISYVGQIINLHLGIQIQTIAQQRVYQQILRLTFPCASSYKIGDLLEYVKVPSMLVTILISPLNQMLVSAFAVLACMVVMISISFPLTCFAAAIFGVSVFFQKRLIGKITRISEFLSDYAVQLSKHTVQTLNGLKTIHSFSRQEKAMHDVKSVLREIAAVTKKLNWWNLAIGPINEVLGISLVGIFLVAGQFYFMSEREGALPLLLTFLVILYRLNTRMQGFLSGWGGVAFYWGQIHRIQEILSDKNKEFSQTGGESFRGLKEGVTFENVSLQYKEGNTRAVQNLNLNVPKGATVAFVGSSGAGKSSIIDLLLRLYEPTEGRISIDNQNLESFSLDSWRSRLGVVSQDLFVFSDSVFENIRFGDPTASLEKVIEAAKLAGADAFIQALPEKYFTVLGENGHRLSGGERQKIALARALVRNPEILILDEATSHLDSDSEQKIQHSVQGYFREKTIIIVAHRLSTVLHADRIFVLDKGEIVESGTHTELLELRGKYAFFWKIQSDENRQAIEMTSL